MSAECRKCGRDLDGDFKCGSCSCEKKLSDLEVENKKLKAVLDMRHNEVLDGAEKEWLLGKKIDELRADLEREKNEVAKLSFYKANADTLMSKLLGELDHWKTNYELQKECHAQCQELLDLAKAEIERLKEYEWKYNDLCK